MICIRFPVQAYKCLVEFLSIVEGTQNPNCREFVVAHVLLQWNIGKGKNHLALTVPEGSLQTLNLECVSARFSPNSVLVRNFGILSIY